MSFQLGNVVSEHQKRLVVLETEVSQLRADVTYLQEIVLNALMKNNPEFKKQAVLSEMDAFLRKKVGRLLQE
jgi:hypothetical protein